MVIGGNCVGSNGRVFRFEVFFLIIVRKGSENKFWWIKSYLALVQLHFLGADQMYSEVCKCDLHSAVEVDQHKIHFGMMDC